MMKKEQSLVRFHTLSEMHRAFGLPKPQHPLVSLSHFGGEAPCYQGGSVRYDVLDFYKITFITENSGRLKYGRGYYDFDEGSMLFLAPNQLVSNDTSNTNVSCYVLLFHPDYLLGHPLARKIQQYGYFSYAANEALHVSETEKESIVAVFKIIEAELQGRIDEFSQEVVLSQLDLLLNYSNRFYKRQFTTRKAVNNDLLENTEAILNDYFARNMTLETGIPTVQYLADKLHITPGYLSDMLRSLIGQNAKQFIHQKLIEKAKEKLSTSAMPISQIAYELGFEHPQSFTKLFKQKTLVTPMAFREQFN